MPSSLGARFWTLLAILAAAMLWAFFGKMPQIEFLGYNWMGIGVDKMIHMLYMGALATLLSKRWSMWPVILMGSALAIGIEFLQPYFHRSFDLTDAAWGIVGTWFAWGLYQTKWYRYLLERKVF